MSEARESAEGFVKELDEALLKVNHTLHNPLEENLIAYLSRSRDTIEDLLERGREGEKEVERLRKDAEGWGRSADAYMESLRKLEQEHGQLQRDYQGQIEHTDYVRTEYQRRLGEMAEALEEIRRRTWSTPVRPTQALAMLGIHEVATGALAAPTDEEETHGSV